MKSYQCSPDGFKFDDQMKEDFENDGYVVIRGLFSKEEVKHVETALTSGPFKGYTYGIEDDKGQEIELVKWSNPGNDVTGMVSRCEKVAGTCEKLLGGEVCHYHTKVMMKRANSGKHLWHQDYGYWYGYGFLRPQMLTVFIAIDKCMQENGCLQILKGSHKVGRIDHSLTAVNSECQTWTVLKNSKRHVLWNTWNLIKVPDSTLLACQEFNNMDGKKFELITDRPYPVRAIGTEQK